MTAPTALTLTAQIVSAHVGRNAVDAEQLPELIRSVFDALATAGQTEPDAQVKQPAVPVKKSVFEDRIVCLECGRAFKMLKRHLRMNHNLGMDDYRRRFGLSWDYPMVAPAYTQTRSSIAKQFGLGRARPRAAGRKKSG